jgi:HEAT repeat protein
MFSGKTIAAILAIVLFMMSLAFVVAPAFAADETASAEYSAGEEKPAEEAAGSAQTSANSVEPNLSQTVEPSLSKAVEPTLEDNWNDFLHYTKIGRLDLAKGYAHAILAGSPDPVKLLALAEENQPGYALLLKVIENTNDPELAELGKKLLAVIEEGRFTRRSDPKIIVEEIARLSGTERGRLAAVKHLQNAGEYAVVYMLDAMADAARKDELPNIIWALPQIGRDAIRPLTAALQTDNVGIKSEIIIALGKIRYPQSLAYLKYVLEKDNSPQLRGLAEESIKRIDPATMKISAAELFYQLAENYYYHSESLQPAEDVNFANIWFWDSADRRLTREKVARGYFNELMAMQACEWALKADVEFGQAIGLWLASFFKAQSTGLNMPGYFGSAHADAAVYATTAGPEYLHQALARAVKDKNAYVALGVVEALAANAGEKSLLYRVGVDQPLVHALSFDDRAVRYSAAIAIASAGPKEAFPEAKLVVENLVEAIGGTDSNSDANTGWNQQLADSYAVRSAEVMLKLAQTRNPVIDLSAAKDALINATKDKREQIRILAGQILAHLDSPDAQRAIAAMALAEDNSMAVRVAAFESLAVSAKLNANLLDDEKIDAIYSLVSSRQIEPKLRSAAATAYGSLNLPSRKVKNLILDQAKS